MTLDVMFIVNSNIAPAVINTNLIQNKLSPGYDVYYNEKVIMRDFINCFYLTENDFIEALNNNDSMANDINKKSIVLFNNSNLNLETKRRFTQKNSILYEF